MHEVGRHFGATLNDVAVTVVDAGLHAYLRETGRAFAHPFISMCPVSLRADGDTTIGTRVSAMFVRLGEPSATAPERIRQVVDSIETAKKELGGMSNDAAIPTRWESSPSRAWQHRHTWTGLRTLPATSPSPTCRALGSPGTSTTAHASSGSTRSPRLRPPSG
ncbi:hypothetical protein [Mycobacterium sp.]|uniref:hypothetical protein n=1 Tax=Mycobacterium sp. TaxID=1785 RepID=UPI003C72D95A